MSHWRAGISFTHKGSVSCPFPTEYHGFARDRLHRDHFLSLLQCGLSMGETIQKATH